MKVNFLGTTYLLRTVFPGMVARRRGHAVAIASISGRLAAPFEAVYSSTKFAIRAMTDVLRFEVRGFGVDVVLIEPGPIRTRFTESANAGMPDGANADGTYAEYHAAVAKADAEADQSKLLAGDPEDVARTIERAVSARRPRARYRVTVPARLLPALRGALSDRAFDAFLRTQASPPGA